MRSVLRDKFWRSQVVFAFAKINFNRSLIINFNVEKYSPLYTYILILLLLSYYLFLLATVNYPKESEMVLQKFHSERNCTFQTIQRCSHAVPCLLCVKMRLSFTSYKHACFGLRTWALQQLDCCSRRHWSGTISSYQNFLALNRSNLLLIKNFWLHFPRADIL